MKHLVAFIGYESFRELLGKSKLCKFYRVEKKIRYSYRVELDGSVNTILTAVFVKTDPVHVRPRIELGPRHTQDSIVTHHKHALIFNANNN